MPFSWYVTFEVHERGLLPKRRSPRATRAFETETEAKDFARSKFHEGLVLYAGTINPYSPKELIAASGMPAWLHGTLEPAQPDGTRGQKSK